MSEKEQGPAECPLRGIQVPRPQVLWREITFPGAAEFLRQVMEQAQSLPLGQGPTAIIVGPGLAMLDGGRAYGLPIKCIRGSQILVVGALPPEPEA